MGTFYLFASQKGEEVRNVALLLISQILYCSSITVNYLQIFMTMNYYLDYYGGNEEASWKSN